VRWAANDRDAILPQCGHTSRLCSPRNTFRGLWPIPFCSMQPLNTVEERLDVLREFDLVTDLRDGLALPYEDISLPGPS